MSISPLLGDAGKEQASSGSTQPAVKLSLSDIRVAVKLGVSEEERMFPQIITLAIDYYLRLNPELVADRLGGTVNYCQVVACLKDRTQHGEWRLVETCVFDLATTILGLSPLISRTRVTLLKNVLEESTGVTATISLSRASLKSKLGAPA